MISSAFEVFDPRIFRIGDEKNEKILKTLVWTLLAIISISLNGVGKSWSSLCSIIGFLIKEVIQYYREFEGRKLSGLKIIFLSTFLVLLRVNIAGLLPFTFRLRSHIFWTFGLGFPLWSLMVIKIYTENPLKTKRKFLPRFSSVEEAPDYFLLLCLGVLEVISLLIQPLTLSIRLMANVGAGHLAIRLGRSVLLIRLSFRWERRICFLFLRFYYFFERAVNLIQAYIFCLLLISYRSSCTPNLSL